MSAADETLRACLASGRSCLMHLDSAADAWSTGEPTAVSLNSAESALTRAAAQVRLLRSLLPGHSRKGRLAFQVLERLQEAFRAVHELPPPSPPAQDDDDEDQAEEADVEALRAVERARGAVLRAMILAEETVQQSAAPLE